MQFLVVLGTGQRRQIKELEQVDGQFPLDDLDVVNYRLGRVVRKTKNVTAIRHDPYMLPGEQHLAVIGDLVLAFFGAEQAVGVDVLEADEYPFDARPLRSSR